MKRKNGIYKGAVVLLIAVFMVLSTIPAVADTPEEVVTPIRDEDKDCISLIESGLYPDDFKPNVIKLPNPDGEIMPIQEGASFGEFADAWINYDGVNANAVGLTSGGDMGAAILLTPTELAGYDEWEIETVRWHQFAEGYTEPYTYSPYVKIYEETAGTATPSNVIYSEQFGPTPAGPAWHDFDLATPVAIDETMDYWVEIFIAATPAGCYPMGIDYVPPGVSGKSCWGHWGGGWNDVSSSYGAWNIRVGVSEGSAGPTAGCDFAVEINSPIGIMNSNPTKLNISIFNFGEDGINEVKVLADIFKEVAGAESNVCCSDVEGNDSVDNWTTSDNGDSDTWTVSDERYHSEGHSWRCTAGRWRDPTGADPDCYLGHAANSDPDELWQTNCQDLSGAEYGRIEFWDFCVGEYFVAGSSVVPTDFGTIAISNDCGQTWLEIPQSQFVAYDNDWRETKIGLNYPPARMDEVDFNVNIALTDEMSIKFSWQTDPHMQYEGWYIDDVCFYRGEPATYELVWQGHQIFWDIPPLQFEPIFYEFFLDWDPEPDTIYKIVVCGQVFDPAGCDQNPSNDCDVEFLEIKDLHDVASISTTGPTAIEICDSPVYTVEIENLGTYPEAGFPVNLEVSRKVSDVWFDGFESKGWYTFYYGSYPYLAHITDCPDFVYDGNNAMAMATTDCDFPMAVPFEFDMIVSTDYFDFTGDNIISGTMEYAAKYSFSTQIGSSIEDPLPPVNCLGENFYDHWFITIQDPNKFGYIIRCTADTLNAVYIGQNGQWEGADAPGAHPGMFTVDLISLMDQLHAVNPSFFTEYKCHVGFGVIMNNDEYILNPANDWSGLFIDNVKVITSYCDDSTGKIVNTTTAPFLAPGDSATVEMTWEDACDYSDWCVCGVTDLDTDENSLNDRSCTITRITETAEDPDWETIDFTDVGGDCAWHIVSKNSCDGFDDEPEEDQYMWCGGDDTGTYLPNHNDELVSEKFDLSGYDYAFFEFDTYFDLESGYDYGYVYYTNDDGAHWVQVATYNGFQDWHVESFSIPGPLTADMKIKFRMYSDYAYEYNGWYIDDVKVMGGVYAGAPDNLYTEPFNYPPYLAGWIDDGNEAWGHYYFTSDPSNTFIGFKWYYGYVGKTVCYNPVPIDTTGYNMGTVAWDHYVDWYSNCYEVGIEGSTDGVTWIGLDSAVACGDVPFTTRTATIPPSLIGGTLYLRVYGSGDTYDIDYVFFDNVKVDCVVAPDPDVVFEDDFENGDSKWSCESYAAGNWWQEDDYRLPPCDDDGVAWYCGDTLIQTYPDGISNALFTEIEYDLTDLGEPYYAADFSFSTWYDFSYDYWQDEWSLAEDWKFYGVGLVQISTDYGSTWHTLRQYVGSSSGWIDESINIDVYLPNVIQIRFFFSSVEGKPVGEGWYVDCFEMHFKHEIYCDTTPPVTTICIDEEAAEASLSAYDAADFIVTGVRATYYILNGGAVIEYTGPFALVEGTNTIEYWSVDKAADLQCADEDNEETHKTKTVVIDNTPPTVSITAPEENMLYLFGNPIMERILGDGTLCIGKIMIEASASDGDGSGITMVTFDIDGDSGYATSAPYQYMYNKKAFGERTVTVTAYDAKGNTATDSATFTIYCLGLF